MKRLWKQSGLLIFLAISLIACQNKTTGKKTSAQEKKTGPPAENSQKERIVSLGGALTEVVAALGHADELVGVDVTSTYPKEVVKEVKNLGHVRSLNIEQVMKLRPTLILAKQESFSEELKQKLKSSEVEVHFFDRNYSVKGTKKLIDQIAKVLGEKNTTPLHKKIEADLAKVEDLPKKPEVLFIYARGRGTMMVAGKNTPMQKIVELAGGEYTINGFESFKPLSPEALIKQNPDVLLLFNSGLKSLGGVKGLLRVKGISKTDAGKNKAIITMNGGFLTSFGPRLGEAAYTLNQKLAQFVD